LQGSRHDDDAKIASRFELCPASHSQREVGIDAALMELVQYHYADTVKKRIVLKLPEKDSGSNDADGRPATCVVVETYAVADAAAYTFAGLLGHAPRGCSGRDATRLQHDDGTDERIVGVYGCRNTSCLTGTRGRAQQDVAAGTERIEQLRKAVVYRKPRCGGS
jgi:hypothetical protein